jgi:hypothetical protein
MGHAAPRVGGPAAAPPLAPGQTPDPQPHRATRATQSHTVLHEGPRSHPTGALRR